MEKAIYLPLLLVAFAAVITLCYVFVLFRKVSRLQLGDKRVEQLQDYIHSGGLLFLL